MGRHLRLLGRGRARWILLVVAVILAGTAGAVAAAPGSAATRPQTTSARAASIPAASTPADYAPAGSGPAAAVTVVPDVVYGQDNGPLFMDVYRPVTHGGPRPGVIVLHGGGWNGGDRSSMADAARALADHGLVAFNLDYRLLTPNTPGFPRQVVDIDAALSYIAAHAADYGVDPAHVGALGASAGGYLALMAALGPDTGLGAVVTWSAPTDLDVPPPAPGSACVAGSCWTVAMSQAVASYLGCPPPDCPALAQAASPVDQVSMSGPPLSVWNSRAELIPVSQADRLVSAARSVGEPAELHLLGGSRHGSQYEPDAISATADFLLEHLGRR